MPSFNKNYSRYTAYRVQADAVESKAKLQLERYIIYQIAKNAFLGEREWYVCI